MLAPISLNLGNLQYKLMFSVRLGFLGSTRIGNYSEGLFSIYTESKLCHYLYLQLIRYHIFYLCRPYELQIQPTRVQYYVRAWPYLGILWDSF